MPGASKVEICQQIPAPTSILCNGINVVNTITGSTIITIPAGRTWYGTVHVAANNTTAVAADAVALVKVFGSGVAPANGTIVAFAAASGATGTTDGGTSGPLYIAAGAGGAATVQLSNSTATTFSSYAAANGVLL